MKRPKFIQVYFLFSLFVFFSCVRESDTPPGCTTPDVPGIKYTRTEYAEGEEIKLEGIEPEGQSNGAFEWQGPNKYLLSQKQLSISNAKEINEGEYKLYYLNEGRCRSKPVSIYIAVYSFAESCGLSKNTVRNQDALIDSKIKFPQQGKDSAGRYLVTGDNDSLQIRIIFPENERPAQTKIYNVTANSGGALANNELDVLIKTNGNWYHATPNETKNIHVVVNSAGLHIAFCSYTFADAFGQNVVFSGNITVP